MTFRPGTNYVDSEDFSGPLEVVFNNALSFISRNLLKVQAGQNINSLGKMEIPRLVFEELLVNALIHRDYFVSAPIRLFVFSDRIEIISPGHLPNNLTIAKIRTGNSNIRNPILASFIAKGLLPYRGLGSGIKRALEEWSEIDFVEDRDGCLFTVKVHRKPVENSVGMPFYSEKGDAQGTGIDVKGALKGRFNEFNVPLNASLSELQNLMLVEITENPKISYLELVEKLNKDRRTIGRNIQQLKEMGVLRRVGSKKTGSWEVAK